MTSRSKLAVAIVLLIGMAAFLTNSCKKSAVDLRHRTTPVAFTVPDGFPAPQYDFSSNPITEEGFALGRKLFHDHTLSSHFDVTCSS